MREWEQKRSNDISEYVLVAHIICLLVFAMIIFSFYNIKLGIQFSSNMIFLFLIFTIVIIIYIARQLLHRLKFIGDSDYIDQYLLLAVIFPLTFGFLWYSHDFYGAKVLIFVPVIIAATTFGKRIGTIVAVLANAFLFYLDFRLFDGLPASVFQADIIICSVTILLAWLMGGLMEVERNTQQELIKLADYDQLTGLYNHRYLQESLAATLKRIMNNDQELALVLIDIDQLKYYNQTFDYYTGDRILSAIGEILTREIKYPSFASRYGNDEFMIVMPGIGKAKAIPVLEQVRQAILSQAAFILEGKVTSQYKSFNISSGIAVYPEDGGETLPLIRAAEKDLFRNKYSEGRSYLYRKVLSEISSLKAGEAFTYLETFVNLINAKDRYTLGHSERVMSYALALAEHLGLSEQEKATLRYGSLLHDIGKLDIETSILTKDSGLNGREWEIMQNHTIWGSEMIQPLSAFKDIVPLVRSHHENFDGSGYPDGLKGEQLPLLVRIIRLADSFDAMTSDRPYRKAMSFTDAYMEIRHYAGSHYDPNLVNPFLDKAREVYQRDIQSGDPTNSHFVNNH